MSPQIVEDLPKALANAVRSAAHAARQTLGEHPDPDELLAYHEGDSTDEKMQQIRAHLALCPECARVLVDLAQFPDVEPRDETLSRSDTEREADWEVLERELDGRIAGHSSPASSWKLWPVAAILATVVFALVFWTADRRSGEYGIPESNLLVVELSPGGEPTRGVAPNRVELPPGVNAVVFILTLADVRSFDDYRATVLDREGRVLARRPGLVRLPDGSFSLQLPRAELRREEMRIELHGQSDSRAAHLATYRIWIEHQTSD